MLSMLLHHLMRLYVNFLYISLYLYQSIHFQTVSAGVNVGTSIIGTSNNIVTFFVANVGSDEGNAATGSDEETDDLMV